MGMFDTVLVAKSLLDKVIDDTDIVLQADSDGYYDFQTKDLDNSMTIFFLEEDGSFVWKKLNQEYIPPTEEEKRKSGFHFGHWKELSPPEKIEDTRTTYIEFYDLYNTETERVFVTFLAHVKNGKLVEPISIKEVEKKNLEEEAIESKKWQIKWDNIRATWEWQIADLIQNLRWKISKIFNPFVRGIDNFENKLRKSAKSKFLNEKDIGYW
jgi:hypothetical protein